MSLIQQEGRVRERRVSAAAKKQHLELKPTRLWQKVSCQVSGAEAWIPEETKDQL